MQLLMTGHMRAEGWTECHLLDASLVDSIVCTKQDCQQRHIAVTPLCCCPPAQEATPKGLPLSPAAAQVGQGLRQHLQTVKPLCGMSSLRCRHCACRCCWHCCVCVAVAQATN